MAAVISRRSIRAVLARFCSMQDFEKLGVFYLGRLFDLEKAKGQDDLLLYDAKDLTTHAVCVGMTGSGKTGLCLSLLEEAAIDGIPAIAIDPKGDLGNLLLTFPRLEAGDFRPWVDPGEATRRGLTPDQFAERTARDWREGLAQWGQDGARIARFREAADVVIYTPGSTAGLPLSVLKSLAAPAAAVRADGDALGERTSAAVAGLLALLGLEADPLRSREHILLANLVDRAWREGRDLDMAGLIRGIQAPPFDKLGFLDLESFYPAKERFDLAMRLNNLLASPGFAAWMEGEPLDIQRLLYTSAGKPRLSILSIAHLADAERMFFVTILLNEIVAWMRAQSGTSSLRALVYMDEVFGYFPPTANPPAKTPMLTLLKQARAYGLGVVLATQNPVDLDYKGLSNAGTWFLGRLQTERDKARVLDGLEGASTSAGRTFDRERMAATLSGLGSRVFLMNNVHDDRPVVFQTRWALSYLRGPLTRDQIAGLMRERKGALAEREAAGEPSLSSAATPAQVEHAPIRPAPTSHAAAAAAVPGGGERPILPPGVPEAFVPRRGTLPDGSTFVYRPGLVGTARVHFVQAGAGVDFWEDVALALAALDRGGTPAWEEATALADGRPETQPAPEEGLAFAELPADLMRPKQYDELAAALKDHLYRTHKLKLWKCGALKLTSQPGESEGAFRTRLGQRAREQRDLAVEKLRGRYAPKLAALEERIRRAEQRVEKEKSQATHQALSAAISFGSSVLGALFGRKLGSSSNIGRAATSMRQAGRAAQERGDIGQAKETEATLRDRLAELEAEFAAEAEKVRAANADEALAVEELGIRPRKTDVAVGGVTLVWTPWRVTPQGLAEAAG
jgi:hypothetical protein